MEALTQEKVADSLLWSLWRSVTEEYKMTYPRDIWDHFENALRSASYTDSLKTFLDTFKKKIPCDIQAQFGKDILSVVESGKDYEVLEWLRTETTYMVLVVRVRNQERKEAYREAQQ